MSVQQTEEGAMRAQKFREYEEGDNREEEDGMGEQVEAEEGPGEGDEEEGPGAREGG